ncbi:MAG: T9SS type A sorting domain-containing protein, partial [Bacteroidaceae bacterium]|nr:T9SS type A sorting domain-containing protein [Bacteroidaceae bacterium]
VSEVTFSQSVPESVEDATNDRLAVSVFPNPVTTQLMLQGLQAESQVRVLSLDGATLIEATAGQGNCRIDVSTLAAGIYVLQVNETTVKFIKK